MPFANVLPAMISAVIMVLKIIMMPPMVGVPVFFICDFGPSSLMLCPNLRRRKNGINKGDKRTVIKNAIAIVNSSMDTLIFFLLVQKPSLVLKWTANSLDYCFKMHAPGRFEQ